MIAPSRFYSEYMRASAAMGIPPRALEFQTRLLLPSTPQGMPIMLVANPHKETRPYAAPTQQAMRVEGCFLDAELERMSGGDGIGMFAGQFPPYQVLPNRYPFGPTHVVLAHNRHSKKPASVPTLNELATLDRFSSEAGCPVWRNVLGTNASAPYHEHAHAMKDYIVFPVSLMQVIGDSDGAGHLIDFPGQHAVFYGPDRVAAAHGLMQRLQGATHPSKEIQQYGLFPFATLIAAGRIFVAPVRTPQISQQHRVGAGELFGYHAAPVETLERATYSDVRGGIARVLFPNNDARFNLYTLLRR